MRKLAPLYAVLITAVSGLCFMVACSQSERYPAGPSSLTSSATHSTADNAPFVSPNSQPTDAPMDFVFEQQGEQHADSTQSVFLSWRHIKTNNGAGDITKYDLEFQRYESTNAWVAVPILGVNYTGPGSTKVQVVLPDGSWRARVRSSSFGNWSAFKTTSIPHPPAMQSAPITPAECFWDEVGPGFFRLFFGRR